MKSPRPQGRAAAPSIMRALAAPILFFLLAFSLGSCSSGTQGAAGDLFGGSARDEASPAPGESAHYVVERVVDGDTVKIQGEFHGTDTVRLIGVDTPESADPEEGVEPMGKEAAYFARRALEGETVELVADEEARDPYGRGLAYAFLDSGMMFNSLLLAEGMAQVAIFPPNTAWEGSFYEHQATAREDGRGIWGLPDSELCLLADRGNGIGEGSEGCAD